MSALADRVAAAFRERYSQEPRLFRAPGRVNLIGEHTDYNGGFVFPAAIEMATVVGMAPREDDRLRAVSLDMEGELDSRLQDLAPSDDWTAYIAGVAHFLGITQGADLLIASDVPIGGGLSSSAALEVATALALGAGDSLPKEQIALTCQRAENEFAGMRCGIMDQFTSVFGREGHALRIDCRDLTYEAVPIPANVRLVIANTMVRHELAASAYNERRAACESAARKLGGATLRDIDPAVFIERRHTLSGAESRCAEHVLTENERTLRFADALRDGKLDQAGLEMRRSHRSLRDVFQVSCEELDAMVEVAAALPGVYGARMTGGGFGGCTINLVDAAHVDAVVASLRAGYKDRTGIDPEIYVTRAGAGASEVTL